MNKHRKMFTKIYKNISVFINAATIKLKNIKNDNNLFV